jgi:CubicO group peptidase (beta-lactamase class C family)
MKKKLFRQMSALLFAALFLFSAALADVSAPSEETVNQLFKKRKTVGGMVVAAKDGEIVFSQCYGFANKVGKEPVTEETYFKLASVSKLVTAVSVMKLVENNQLDLDQDIGEILGDPAYHAANPNYPKIALTSRMLMTHTAAINDSAGAFAGMKPLNATLNPKENKKKSGFLKVKPGTEYKYSNYGAGIMGCIIEAVTEKRLSDAARELIFDPMGIDAAYDPHLLQDPEKIVSTYNADGSGNITRSYRLKQKYREEIDLDKDYADSYGGVWIRGEDLCRIGIMLCDMGVIDGRRILEEDTIREMLSSQQGKGGITVDSPYGLNVERVTNLLRGKMLYGHQGMANGVLCNLYFDPETRFVFALLTNGTNVKAKEDRICLLARDLFNLMWNTYANE